MAFLPNSLANLYCWVEADQGVYQDSAEAVPCTANGDECLRWHDQSGNSRHVTNYAGGAGPGGQADAPLYELAVVPISLKPILRFNGTNSAMTGVFTMPAEPKTLFIYARIVAAQAANKVLFDQRANDTMEIRLNGTDQTKFDVYGGAFITQALPVGAGTFHLFEVIWNGGSSAVYQDGTLINAATDGGGASSTGIMLGAYFGPSRWLAMDLAEVVIYSDAKGTTDRQSVESYFSIKYGTAPAGFDKLVGRGGGAAGGPPRLLVG